MLENAKTNKGLDLAFAAVSFGCVLAIFGAGASGHTRFTLKAAHCYAIFLPLLVGANTAENVIKRFQVVSNQRWAQSVLFAAELLAGIAVLGCYAGIYWIFRAISEQTATLFLNSSFTMFGLAILLAKGVSVYDFINQRKKEEKRKA